MKAVTHVVSPALPLRRDDVDTDQIVPSAFLTRTSRTGYTDALFATWREQPDFPLHDERYADAKILIAGANFGSGSSREHAVWALQDYGFQAVVSSRFPDIFRRNALRNGLVPVQVSAEVLEQLFTLVERTPSIALRLDVASAMLTWPGGRSRFELSESERERLLTGRDEVSETLRQAAAISVFEAARAVWLPSTR